MGKKLAIHSHFNPEFFEIAGRIHDIWYARDEKNHANESLNILKEKWYNIDSVLQDCIINHGSSKQPHTAEGRLFQLIDKLSFFWSRYHRTSPEIWGTSSLERIFKQKLSISVNFTR
jgi:predicted hydrolase (HD superfamily)